MKDRKIHELNISPEHFEAVITGDKTFEARINDRDYKRDDFVIYHEFTDEDGYTGRKIIKRIGYILYGEQCGIGVGESLCVFGLKDVAISCKSCIHKSYYQKNKMFCNKYNVATVEESFCSDGFPELL